MNKLRTSLLAIAFLLPTAAGAQRVDPVYVEDRFNQLQQSITLLTGQIEQLQYRNQQLQQQLEKMQADYEYRLDQMEKGKGGGGPRPGGAQAAAPAAADAGGSAAGGRGERRRRPDVPRRHEEAAGRRQCRRRARLQGLPAEPAQACAGGQRAVLAGRELLRAPRLPERHDGLRRRLQDLQEPAPRGRTTCSSSASRSPCSAARPTPVRSSPSSARTTHAPPTCRSAASTRSARRTAAGEHGRRPASRCRRLRAADGAVRAVRGRARRRRRRVRRTRFAGPGAAGAGVGRGARRSDRRADRRPCAAAGVGCGSGGDRVPARTPWVRGRDPALVRGQAAHAACRKQRARRAIGCCARPAVGAAFSICWSRTMPMIRPRPWPCAPPGKAGPMALPACRRRSSCRRCGCCGRCSGFPDRASPRRCSPVACRGSTILPTPIRASSGQGCAPAIDRQRRPPIAAVRPASKSSLPPRSRSWISRRQAMSPSTGRPLSVWDGTSRRGC